MHCGAMAIAQRFAIIASASGNGKSTLARRLARRLDAPWIELDRLVLAIRLRRRLLVRAALVGAVLGFVVPKVLLGGPTATASVLVSRGDKIGPLNAYEAKAALLKAAGANVSAGGTPRLIDASSRLGSI